jgi:hypothetical protein
MGSLTIFCCFLILAMLAWYVAKMIMLKTRSG